VERGLKAPPHHRQRAFRIGGGISWQIAPTDHYHPFVVVKLSSDLSYQYYTKPDAGLTIIKCNSSFVNAPRNIVSTRTFQDGWGTLRRERNPRQSGHCGCYLGNFKFCDFSATPRRPGCWSLMTSLANPALRSYSAVRNRDFRGRGEANRGYGAG
jgi:hypothetical protein